MRLMSFAATIEQMRAGTKTVTRRLDSKGFYLRTLKPGTLVLACAKTRNVKREDRDALGVIEIVDVRREALARFEIESTNELGEWGYVYPPVGDQFAELAAEGFPVKPGEGWGWCDFCDLFFKANGLKLTTRPQDVTVTRIEFRHRPDLTTCCGAERGWVRAERLGSVDRNVCTKCGRSV